MPTSSTDLEMGSGPLGQGTVGTQNVLWKWGEGTGHLCVSCHLNPAYSLPHWGVTNESKPSNVGEPGKLTFLPGSKSRTGEELTHMVILSKYPKELKEQPFGDL